jgi:pseudouridine-5'-phosphate glycosidase
MQNLSNYLYLTISPEVQAALEDQRPVVALESTVIAHGLPYPANLEIARDMEAVIRAEGAVPATIGLFDGRIVVGLSASEIEQLATAEHVLKVSRRDLAVALATRQLGATTVAGTMLCASLAESAFSRLGASAACIAARRPAWIFPPI